MTPENQAKACEFLAKELWGWRVCLCRKYTITHWCDPSNGCIPNHRLWATIPNPFTKWADFGVLIEKMREQPEDVRKHFTYLLIDGCAGWMDGDQPQDLTSLNPETGTLAALKALGWKEVE